MMERKILIQYIILAAVILFASPFVNAAPVVSIFSPSGEYFTYGLPATGIPINFTYVEANPYKCWYSIDSVKTTPFLQINTKNDTSYYDGGELTDPTNAYDGDWSTYAINGGANIAWIYENYTIPSGSLGNDTYLTAKVKSDSGPSDNVSILYWNYTKNGWETDTIYDCVQCIVTTAKIYLPSDALTGSKVQIKTRPYASSGLGARYYESNISWDMGVNCSLNATFNQSIDGNHTFHFFINNTSGEQGSSSSPFSINLLNASHYVNKGNVTEGENVTFFLQINSTNMTSINASLVYNNTFYGYTTIVNTSKQANITKTINIPLTGEASASSNRTFYWNFTMNAHNNVTDLKNISVSKATVGNCSGGGITALRFNMLDEQNSTSQNMDFAISITTWVGDQLINYTYNISMLGRQNYSICISPNYTNFSADAVIEYAGNTPYARRFYYLDNAEISNSTQVINLYSLLLSLSTVTEFSVTNQYTQPYRGAIIHIQRYDTATSSYYTVGMLKTSYTGSDVGYFNWYDTIYKPLVFYNGELILSAQPQKISSTPVSLTVIPSTLFSYDKFTNLQYTLIFNNATRNFILTYADASGFISAGCLKVTKHNASDDIILCDYCIASTSATLFCNVGSENATYNGQFYAKGSYSVIANVVVRIIDFSNDIYSKIGNVDGTIYTILLTGTVTMAGIFGGPTGALIMFLIGLWISSMIGIYSSALIIPSIFSIGVIIVIIIWRGRN